MGFFYLFFFQWNESQLEKKKNKSLKSFANGLRIGPTVEFRSAQKKNGGGGGGRRRRRREKGRKKLLEAFDGARLARNGPCPDWPRKSRIDWSRDEPITRHSPPHLESPNGNPVKPSKTK